MRTLVWIKTSFVGYHRWKDAPDKVRFLRDWHRHLFHVKVMIQVSHDNRDVEFILLKKQVDDHIREVYAEELFEYSCEQIAKQLLDQFKAELVEVSEDGENGAIVTRN